MSTIYPQESSLKEFLSKEVNGISGLIGLVVSDRDGIPIIQEWNHRSNDLQTKFQNNSQMTVAFGSMSEQANKLSLGTSEVFIACYNKYQVVQVNELQAHQCVITLFAKSDCNSGLLLEKRDTWRRIADVVNRQVLSIIRAPGML